MSSEETRPPDVESAAPLAPEPEGAESEALVQTGDAKPPQADSRFPVWLACLLIAAGALFPFCIMASERRLVISVPVGLLGVALVSVGTLGLLGAFRASGAAASPSAATPVTGRALLVPLLRWLASGIGLVVAGRLAVAGVLPAPTFSSGLLMTAGFVWGAVETFNVGVALGVYKTNAIGDEDSRGLLQRYGFWLIVLLSLLHLPRLGTFGLIDPWETHYGEVAREMLARDDWISLWWAHDGWFWSKPIFNFWLQGLSFKLFGVEYMPGHMLAGIVEGRVPQPEWACRFPVFLLATIGAYGLYKGVAVPFGRRVAFVGSLVLATSPYWYLIERQTMADMPYVAPLTAAMGLLLLGFHTDPHVRVENYAIKIGKRTLELNGFHLLFFAIVLCTLPQALYLMSRNVTLHTADGLFGFEPHVDQFMKGSGGGNCGLPGNAACKTHVPQYPQFQPVFTGLATLAITFGLLFWYRKEQRRQVLYFLSGWFFTALAVMGKGAPGLVIPLAVALAYPVITGRFRELLRMQLPALVLLVLVIVGPWYLQMYLRHGFGFIERLILHDMFKRAFVHVHDTNKGDDTSFRYYLWQLGYGLFPWTGFAAVGFAWLGRGSERRDNPRWHANLFLLTWWLVAFGMFTITLTKFHHYILPLVPPTAIFAGVVVAKYLPRGEFAQLRTKAAYYGGLLVSAALVCWGVLSCVPGRISGRVVSDDLPPGNLLGIAPLVLGLGLAYLVHRKFGPAEPESPAPTPKLARSRQVLATLAILAAVPLFLSGRDMFVTRKGDVAGQARLIHLFTYNYERKWPTSLDFDGVFLAATLVAVVFTLAMAYAKWRKSAAVLFCATSYLFSVWCSDVYFVNVAPHWGQRETMLAYYQHRKGPEEQLIAYQMNWKGENFYTGNRMATFVATGKKFKSWITDERQAGRSTFYITTEHTRLKNLKKELDDPPTFEVLTDETLNNKFALARASFPPLPAKPATADTDDDDEPNEPSSVGSQE